jgi:hypothetical protein
MYFTFSEASFSNSCLSQGIIISSFEIEIPERVAYLYQKFFISSTNFAVISEPKDSKLFESNFLIAHLFNFSFTNHIHSGTISLNKSLP